MKTEQACCASSHTYEFEYLSEAKLSNRRTNTFTSTLDLKVGDAVVIEKESRGIFLGRIVGVSDIVEESGYKYIVHAGDGVTAYINALEREKRKEELRVQMEAKFKEIDKERKFEYYATLDESFGALYKEYKEL